jgi:hypothetical protein
MKLRRFLLFLNKIYVSYIRISHISFHIMDNNYILGMYEDCINIDPNELIEAPLKTNDPKNPDADNGLITNIWGPHEWESFHAKTFGYPINPSDQQKKDYLEHFISLGKVLPCVYCRGSYQKFISEGDTFLNIDTMKSRETLTRWGHRLHDAVNKKLGVEYGETYEEMCYKFESYRAKCTKTEKGCLMPLDMKAKSYQKASIQRAPIIDIKYSLAMIDHAKTLGMKNYERYLKYYAKLKRNTKEWSQRDCAARKIIRYMRKKGISSLDSNGLPSYYEMILICMLSTTLDKEKLDDIINKVSRDYIDSSR